MWPPNSSRILLTLFATYWSTFTITEPLKLQFGPQDIFRSESSLGNSVSLYGYINNEHYPHYMPGVTYRGWRAEGRIGGEIHMECADPEVVHIFLVALHDQEVLPHGKHGKASNASACELSTAKRLITGRCENMGSCKFLVTEAALPSKNSSACNYSTGARLSVEYGCRYPHWPKPLYNTITNQFIEGVAPDFLHYPDTSADCEEKQSLQTISLKAAQKRCSLDDSCEGVVLNYRIAEAFLCIGAPPKLTSSPRSITAIKGTSLKAKNFAVYLNHRVKCKKVVEKETRATTDGIQEAATKCRDRPDCTYLIIDLTGPSSSTLTLCAGSLASAVHQDGSILAVKVTIKQGPMGDEFKPTEDVIMGPLRIFTYKQGYPTVKSRVLKYIKKNCEYYQQSCYHITI